MEKLELVYLPKGKYCVYPRMVYRLAIVMPPPILDGRKWILIAFLAISDQYATLIFFHKMAAGGHFWWPKITFDRISRHFWSIRNFYFFTKWLPAAILDDRKSLFIAFLAISDQYTTFFFTNWLPAAILDDRNSLWSHFSPFQINTQLFCVIFFQNGRQRPFWKSDLRQIQSGSSTMCYQWLCQIWIWPMNLWHS